MCFQRTTIVARQNQSGNNVNVNFTVLREDVLFLRKKQSSTLRNTWKVYAFRQTRNDLRKLKFRNRLKAPRNKCDFLIIFL